MSIKLVFDVAITGLIMGGIYALIAMGLNLQYGVARVLNVSHGEFVMVGAFIPTSRINSLGSTLSSLLPSAAQYSSSSAFSCTGLCSSILEEPLNPSMCLRAGPC